MSSHRAQFRVGQLVHHKRFDYRGVIVDVDATFQGTEEWYETMAQSRPPKDRPWYHVLVHGGEHATYAAQDSLEPYQGGEQVLHPLVRTLFESFSQGRYQARTGAHFPGLW